MRIAVITGASSGLGREYVCEVAKTEPDIDEIWVIARRKSRLEELQKHLKIPVRALVCDLTNPKSIDGIEELYSKKQPEIALLINNAGFGKIGNYEAVGRDFSNKMIDLNCRAAVDMTYISIPYMVRGSRIMEVCSTAAFQPFQYLGIYAASKAFLYRFSRALRIELLGRGIKVTAVCPYWIKDTEFIPTAKKTADDGRAIKHFPLASTARSVAKHSLIASRLGLPVSTPGIMCTAHRIVAKFIPSEIMMGIWALLRRV